MGTRSPNPLKIAFPNLRKRFLHETWTVHTLQPRCTRREEKNVGERPHRGWITGGHRWCHGGRCRGGRRWHPREHLPDPSPVPGEPGSPSLPPRRAGGAEVSGAEGGVGGSAVLRKGAGAGDGGPRDGAELRSAPPPAWPGAAAAARVHLVGRAAVEDPPGRSRWTSFDHFVPAAAAASTGELL